MSSSDIRFAWASPALLGLFLTPPLAVASAAGAYTVIIPLYNKKENIRASVLSALNQTKRPFEVIVVDDKSTDDSLKEIEDLGDKITIIRNEENMGKAASIEKALKRVQTRYVLVLDADTVLDKQFTHEAMRGFYDGDVKGVTGTVLPLDPKTRTQNARLIEYLLGVPSKITQAKMKGIWTLAGCCMLWKTDFLKKIGLDRDTVVEDMDASWSAQAEKNPDGKHYKLGFNPKAIAYTAEPETFNRYVKQVDRWLSIKPVLKKNFKNVSKGLKTLTVWVFAESMIPILWIGLAAWLLLTGNIFALGIMLLFDLLTLTAISAYLGRKYGYGLGKIIKGIGWFWIYRFVNAFQFWRRLIKPKKKWQ